MASPNVRSARRSAGTSVVVAELKAVKGQGCNAQSKIGAYLSFDRNGLKCDRAV